PFPLLRSEPHRWPIRCSIHARIPHNLYSSGHHWLRLRWKVRAKKIEKRPPPPPSVVVLQLEPLQEHQRAEHVGVAQRLHPAGFGQASAELVDRLLQRFLYVSRTGISRPWFVGHSGVGRPVG